MSFPIIQPVRVALTTFHLRNEGVGDQGMASPPFHPSSYNTNMRPPRLRLAAQRDSQWRGSATGSARQFLFTRVAGRGLQKCHQADYSVSVRESQEPRPRGLLSGAGVGGCASVSECWAGIHLASAPHGDQPADGTWEGTEPLRGWPVGGRMLTQEVVTAT